MLFASFIDTYFLVGFCFTASVNPCAVRTGVRSRGSRVWSGVGSGAVHVYGSFCLFSFSLI